MTWGAIRPVILLPAYVEDWAEEQRDVVIRHERAHIERRDWLWQGFAQVMTAVFWFHPLVWLAAAQMRQEAEHAADDATLATGVQAPDYADRLMAVARQIQGSTPASRCRDGSAARVDVSHRGHIGYCPDANQRECRRANRSGARSSGITGPAQRISESRGASGGRRRRHRSVRDVQGGTELTHRKRRKPRSREASCSRLS